jgi:hypothetical protein
MGTMAPARLSQLQRRILAWLATEEQRTRSTMRASHEELVPVLAHDKGNLSHLTPAGRWEIVNKEEQRPARGD